MFKNILVIIVIIFSTNALSAQVAEDSELYRTLKQYDSILFNAAFNTCNTDVLEKIFTEDFEFYHDKGGMTIGRESFLKPMKENCAKMDAQQPQPAKRILLEGSLRVYPLYNKGALYGAIQHGVHRFEFLDANKEYQKGDIAKFTHVWIKENNTWKVKRELSYDHQYKPK
ncbi:nuclear transport factor 2 family protein [Costertonia aggregata]|uniref:Nuclear transport factor 2 family protein n=1 Tax=Costertonia aggregata TaxID=343403 RepID=A0A7H9AL03_9FLAO|nr:nuclear transport factor 2 family protein [Costertonia aggregata]QLG44033.1 nuclear transport factor 2 family protein [Costertonia aggregata]